MLFPAKQKTAQFFPFIFCFIRELNLYSPLTFSLILRANSNPILPLIFSLYPPIRPYLTHHPPSANSKHILPPHTHPSDHPPTRRFEQKINLEFKIKK